jgi:hypothetical protein
MLGNLFCPGLALARQPNVIFVKASIVIASHCQRFHEIISSIVTGGNGCVNFTI